jgi:hypothetical protein
LLGRLLVGILRRRTCLLYRLPRLLAGLTGSAACRLAELTGSTTCCLAESSNGLACGLPNALPKPAERLPCAAGELAYCSTGAQCLAGCVREAAERLACRASRLNSLLGCLSDVA